MVKDIIDGFRGEIENFWQVKLLLQKKKDPIQKQCNKQQTSCERYWGAMYINGHLVHVSREQGIFVD